MKTSCELLAPAGNMNAVYAAVQSGADAVYIGGSTFSARASAGNFTNEEIEYVVKYCHLRGVHVHVALNTLIKQDEFEKAFEFALFLYNAGVDALIIQDIGLASVIKEKIPDFTLHASTQMTIHNADDAMVLKKIGFSRVVVARELSFDEIKEIKTKTGMEIEMFVHGAICQSYSGQCLFSSLLGGRSGNRGRCAQPCRMEYEFCTQDKEALKRGYLLSPKDMCLVKHLDKIKSAQIDSLKIEGRLKRAEYVATVVGVYRKYLDNQAKVSDADYETLLDAFNRSGFTDGYFTKNTGSAMMSYKSPSNIAKEKFDSSVDRLMSENANERKVFVNMRLTMKYGRDITLCMSDDKNEVTVSGGKCEKAISKAADYEFVKKQLSRLGNTVFALNEFYADIDEGVGIGSSELNELRRSACEALIEKRTENNRCMSAEFKLSAMKAQSANKVKITVQVSNLKQAQIAEKLGVERIYAPKNVADKINGAFVKCDDITRNTNILSDNILSSHLSHAEKMAAGDFRLNIFNSESIKIYRQLGFQSVCLSPELNFNEIKGMGKTLKDCEIIAYGKLPVMLMKNCVIKALSGKCGANDKNVYYLKDRKKEKFSIICNGSESCSNTLLNSKPVYMADKAADILKSGVGYVRLMFWDETEQECEQIINAYKCAFEGENFTPPSCAEENRFTRGHFYRGVL